MDAIIEALKEFLKIIVGPILNFFATRAGTRRHVDSENDALGSSAENPLYLVVSEPTNVGDGGSIRAFPKGFYDEIEEEVESSEKHDYERLEAFADSRVSLVSGESGLLPQEGFAGNPFLDSSLCKVGSDEWLEINLAKARLRGEGLHADEER